MKKKTTIRCPYCGAQAKLRFCYNKIITKDPEKLRSKKAIANTEKMCYPIGG